MTATATPTPSPTAAAQPGVAPADTIDVAEFRRLLRDEPALRILDVRSGAEFQAVHIPGSYNVPLETLQEHTEDLADVRHPVVLVCQSGNRASTAGQRLAGAGKTSLHILGGGMAAWLADGGEVVRQAPTRWAMDRQVRLVAGSLALLAVAASTALPRAKWLAAAVGAGLAYSAVSNTCAMATVLSRLPYNRGPGCDIAGVLAALDDQAADPDQSLPHPPNQSLPHPPSQSLPYPPSQEDHQ